MLEESRLSTLVTGIWNVVQDYGADNSGSADATSAITNAITDCGSAGGGIVFMPQGKFLISSSLDLTLTPNVHVMGDGMYATTLVCTTAFNGSSNITASSIIRAQPTLPGTYVNGLSVSDLTVDCSQQNSSGMATIGGQAYTMQSASSQWSQSFIFATIPAGLGAGDFMVIGSGDDIDYIGITQITGSGPYTINTDRPALFTHSTSDPAYFYTPSGRNLCGIEFQNVHHGRCTRVRVLNAFGNGIVIASLMPGISSAVLDPIVESCVFESCVRGVLPQYGIAGSGVQIGAALGGRIVDSVFHNTGGPATDTFNCTGISIERNYLYTDFAYTPTRTGYKQSVNTIHSDFGLLDSTIRDNRCEEAGGIWLLGNASTSPNPTGGVATNGPTNCVISGNAIRSTAQYEYSNQPALGASGTVYQNTQPFDAVLYIQGGSGLTASVGQYSGSLSPIAISVGSGFYQLAVPAGYYVQISWTTAPTSWTWYVSPNAYSAAITILAGNVSGEPAVSAQSNVISNNQIVNAAAAGISLFDSSRNTVSCNTIQNQSSWVPSPAIIVNDTEIVSGSGCQDNRFLDNAIFEDRSTQVMPSNYQELPTASSGNQRNRFTGNRIVTGKTATFQLGTSTDFYAANNFGPEGQPLPVTTSIATPAFPLSGTSTTNTTAYDVLVYVWGGTSLSIKINAPSGIVIGPLANGAQGSSVLVRQGESVTLFYNGSPSWAWQIAQ